MPYKDAEIATQKNIGAIYTSDFNQLLLSFNIKDL